MSTEVLSRHLSPLSNPAWAVCEEQRNWSRQLQHTLIVNRVVDCWLGLGGGTPVTSRPPIVDCREYSSNCGSELFDRPGPAHNEVMYSLFSEQFWPRLQQQYSCGADAACCASWVAKKQQPKNKLTSLRKPSFKDILSKELTSDETIRQTWLNKPSTKVNNNNNNKRCDEDQLLTQICSAAVRNQWPSIPTAPMPAVSARGGKCPSPSYARVVASGGYSSQSLLLAKHPIGHRLRNSVSDADISGTNGKNPYHFRYRYRYGQSTDSSREDPEADHCSGRENQLRFGQFLQALEVRPVDADWSLYELWQVAQQQQQELEERRSDLLNTLRRAQSADSVLLDCRNTRYRSAVETIATECNVCDHDDSLCLNHDRSSVVDNVPNTAVSKNPKADSFKSDVSAIEEMQVLINQQNVTVVDVPEIFTNHSLKENAVLACSSKTTSICREGVINKKDARISETTKVRAVSDRVSNETRAVNIPSSELASACPQKSLASTTKVSATNNAPLVANSPLSASTDSESSENRSPSATKHRELATNNTKSVIPKPPSLVSKSSSAVSKSPSVVAKSPPAVNKSPSVVAKSPSAVNKSPSVIDKPISAEQQTTDRHLIRKRRAKKRTTSTKPTANVAESLKLIARTTASTSAPDYVAKCSRTTAATTSPRAVDSQVMESRNACAKNVAVEKYAASDYTRNGSAMTDNSGVKNVAVIDCSRNGAGNDGVSGIAASIRIGSAVEKICAENSTGNSSITKTAGRNCVRKTAGNNCVRNTTVRTTAMLIRRKCEQISTATNNTPVTSTPRLLNSLVSAQNTKSTTNKHNDGINNGSNHEDNANATESQTKRVDVANDVTMRHNNVISSSVAPPSVKNIVTSSYSWSEAGQAAVSTAGSLPCSNQDPQQRQQQQQEQLSPDNSCSLQ